MTSKCYVPSSAHCAQIPNLSIAAGDVQKSLLSKKCVSSPDATAPATPSTMAH